MTRRLKPQSAGRRNAQAEGRTCSTKRDWSAQHAPGHSTIMLQTHIFCEAWDTQCSSDV